MTELPVSLPLIVLGNRGGESLECIRHESYPAHAIAFTDLEKAANFMGAHGGRNWEFTFISRPGLGQLVGELIEQRLEGVHVDPNPEGTGGMVIEVEQLAAVAQQVRA